MKENNEGLQVFLYLQLRLIIPQCDICAGRVRASGARLVVLPPPPNLCSFSQPGRGGGVDDEILRCPEGSEHLHVAIPGGYVLGGLILLGLWFRH